MSKFIDWRDYQDVRRKLAEYTSFVIYHEPKEDLNNDNINEIFLSQITITPFRLPPFEVYNTVHIKKSRRNPFYRDIEIGTEFSTEDYFLIDPSTMPKANIVNSILSWETRSSHINNTLSQEDREKHPWLFKEGLAWILREEGEYEDLFTEV